MSLGRANGVTLVGPFFSYIRDAAANWGGTDPIRRRR
jgi:hypothetical protein